MAPNIKDYGISSYCWKLPEITPERARSFREAKNRRLNETAKRNGFSGAWVRALGGTPDPASR